MACLYAVALPKDVVTLIPNKCTISIAKVYDIGHKLQPGELKLAKHTSEANWDLKTLAKPHQVENALRAIQHILTVFPESRL